MSGGDDEPAGGDPVCWVHLTCPECGAIPDHLEQKLDRCPRCGAERSPSEASPSEGCPGGS